MQFNAWAKNIRIVPKEQGQQVIIALRVDAEEMDGEKLDGLRRSVFRAGSKVVVNLGVLRSDGTTAHTAHFGCFLTSWKVVSNSEGRFVQLVLAAPGVDVSDADLHHLRTAVVNESEPTIEVDLMPVADGQIEIPTEKPARKPRKVAELAPESVDAGPRLV